MNPMNQTQIKLLGAFNATMQTLCDLNSEPRTEFWETQYLFAFGGASAMFMLMKLDMPEHKDLAHAAKLLNDVQEDLVMAGRLPKEVSLFV